MTIRVYGLEEGMRLEALEREQITDTPRDEAFDAAVQDACTALKAPMGAISFLEKERLWIKAGHGLALSEAPRQGSLCGETLLGDGVMVVEDASREPRFAVHPFVTEADVRFYAGVPLTTREGFRLGTLSVMDDTPRPFGPQDRARLKEMAARVVHALEARRRAGMDAATDLYTRQFFHEVAGREVIMARRAYGELTLAIIGGGQGDGGEILRAMAAATRRRVRDRDLQGRQGQDLVMLLPATALRHAGPVLERLRADFARLVELKGRTISIGATALAPEDLTIDDLLTRAGQTLDRIRGRARLALAA